MQDIDGFMHVRPFIKDSPFRGLAMFFNPTSYLIKDMIEIPLYYTGLETEATVILQGNKDTAQKFQLQRDYTIEVPLSKLSRIGPRVDLQCLKEKSTPPKQGLQ